MTIFLALLRNALWNSEEEIPHELSEKDAKLLFSLASQQAISGLILDSLIRNNVKIPQHRVFEAIGLVEQIKHNSKKINTGVLQLHQLMKDTNCQYVIVKGQPVATYYPNALLRQSGDIDYYCDAKNFEKSRSVIRKTWGIDAEPDGSEYHVHYDYKGVIYEGHFSLATLYSKNRQSYWQHLLDVDKISTVNIDGVDIPTLSPTLHTLFVFLHLYHHLMDLGVGLRQFCDLAVMLHYAKDQIDMNALRKHLDELGMEKAWRACGCLLIDYLGLPEEELGYSLYSTDRKYGKKILDVVLYRGNMGHYNKRGGFSGWKHKLEAVGIKLSHFAKFMPLAPSYSCGWLWHEVKRSL